MIVDANAISAWLDDETGFSAVLTEAADIILSSIALGEYRFGVKASRYATLYGEQLDAMEEDFSIARVDGQTAQHYADIRDELKAAGTPIPWHDVWIAAQARQLGCPILSKDKHFDCVSGLKRVSW